MQCPCPRRKADILADSIESVDQQQASIDTDPYSFDNTEIFL